MLDDLANIVENPHIFINALSFKELEFAASTVQTGYQYERGLSFVSFALNYYGSGRELVPLHIKLTNVFIHAFNAALVFFLLKKSFKAIHDSEQRETALPALMAAGFITILWACHPIQVSTVLYAVQRMTLLAATTTLLGCLAFVTYRTSPHRTNYGLLGVATTVGACILIGFHFKENAVLLPVYLIAIELVLRNWLPSRRIESITLLLVTLLPGLLGLAYLGATLGEIQASYEFRNFTLGERLLTQPLVLFWYLKLLLIPNLSDYSLFLDNFPISRSLMEPRTTSLAIASGAALLAVGLLRACRYTLLPALIWFLGGHLLESSVLPLELAFEHRNYLPALGPLILCSTVIFSGLQKLSIRPGLIATMGLSLLLIVSGLTAVRAHFWGDDVRFIVNSIENRPSSARAQSAAGLYYAVRDPQKAYEHYKIAATFHPDDFSSQLNQYVILATIYNLYHQLDDKDIDANLKNFRSTWTEPSLKAELDSIETAIVEILRTEVISAQTVEMLERAVHCRVNNLHSCPDAETLMTWIDAAIANPRQRSNFRAYVQFSKCRLLTKLGKTDEALALMNQLVERHPEIDFFTVKLAELYQLLGDEQKAAELYRRAPEMARERYQ